MKTKFTINEFLFKTFLFFAISGGIFKCAIGKWIPVYNTYKFVSQGRVGTLFCDLSLFILLILIVRCNLKYSKRLPQRIQVMNIIVLLCYIIWTIYSLKDNSVNEVIFGGISTSIILLTLICPIGYDLKIWHVLENSIMRINFILATVFFILFINYIKNYGLQWPMYASYKGIFNYWITSTWVSTFIFSDNKKMKKILYINNCFIIVAAFITQSRAWVLQTFLLLFIMVLLYDKNSKIFKSVVSIIIVFTVFILVSYIFPNITGNLFDRGLEDTRSGQFQVFFSQHRVYDLILGLGLNATYKYLGNSFYPYFDNQFMFIMFHYGVIPVIAWFSVYFSLFKNNSIVKNEELKVVNAGKFVSTFVLMAYLGLSTYYQVEIGYSSVLVMILCGNAISRIYKRR